MEWPQLYIYIKLFDDQYRAIKYREFITLPSVSIDAARDNFPNSTGMRCCSYMESENYRLLDISTYTIHARNFALIQFYNARTIGMLPYNELRIILYLFFVK